METRRGRRADRPTAGFTLIEVLVVIGIVSLLMLLLVPAVQNARQAARRLQCASNLRQIGLGLSQYITVEGQLPAGDLPNPGGEFVARRSGFVAILPHIEGQAIFNGFNVTEDMNAIANLTSELARPALFVCPADAGTERLLS